MDAAEIQHEDDLLIINDVARAVEEHEFVPYVQPCYKFELNGRRIIAAETLVRWTLPEDGTVVPAGAFVPSLERTNTICGLDWFMADEMCSFFADAKGTAAMLPFALNISSQHAADAEFTKKLAATADWRGIEHRFVSIELSQKLIAEDDRVREKLVPDMVQAGFGVIADNFHADAEALRQLKELGITNVKVSAKLWRDGAKEDVEKVVALAKELNLPLVAESVENDEELASVIEAGFGYAQGYGLAYPMSLEDFVALLEK